MFIMQSRKYAPCVFRKSKQTDFGVNGDGYAVVVKLAQTPSRKNVDPQNSHSSSHAFAGCVLQFS